MAITYTESFLGKPIESITVDDVKEYFSVDREEYLTLEFKSFYDRNTDYRYKEDTVLKTICGFLNSQGGLLIWGAPVGEKREVDGKKIKVFTGDLSPVDRFLQKDDLISKISNRITPLSYGIKVNVLQVEQGKYIYLFEVPESISKPHQFDDRYFIRLDGQTKVAPHYVVEALFKQIKTPDLQGFIRVTEIERVAFDQIIFTLNVFIINTSKVINALGSYFLIQTETGKLYDSQNDALVNNKFRAKQLTHIDSFPVLSYGLHSTITLYFVLKQSEFIDSNTYNEPIILSLTFGAKNSPAKVSSYNFRISDWNIELKNKFTSIEHLSQILHIKKQENMLATEEWDGEEDKWLETVLSGI